MNIRKAAALMTAVAIQPRMMSDRLAVKAPITDLFETSKMITTIRGTATTPLMTALQNKAFIGLKCGVFMGDLLSSGSIVPCLG